MSDVTQILSQIESGDPKAAEQLLPLVYEELRKLAALRIAQEKPGQTLQATALVHDAYIRLVDVEKVQHWDSRGHFFSAAAEAMRRILIDQARRKKSMRRNAEGIRVAYDDVGSLTISNESSTIDLLALNDALDQLAAVDSVKAELVKLRYFAGLSLDDAAQSLGISRATAKRYWVYARSWLFGKIENE